MCENKIILYILIIISLFLFVGVYDIKKDSADGRLFMWKISIKAIVSNPMGYGKGKFFKAYGDTQEAYFASGKYSSREEWVAGCPEYAFNEYLRVAVEYGIFPLLVCLAIGGFCFYKGYRHNRIGFCGMFISLAIFSFASYPFSLPEFWFMLLLLVIALLYDTDYIGHSFLLLLLFVGGICGIIQYRNYVSSQSIFERWREASYLYYIGDYHEALDVYADLEPNLCKDYHFMFEYGYALHQVGFYDESSRVLLQAMEYSADPMILNIIGKNFQKTGYFSEAEHWYYRAHNRLPNRHYPYYLLAQLYADSAYYQPERLKNVITIFMEKKPKVISPAIYEMRKELKNILKTK